MHELSISYFLHVVCTIPPSVFVAQKVDQSLHAKYLQILSYFVYLAKYNISPSHIFLQSYNNQSYRWRARLRYQRVLIKEFFYIKFSFKTKCQSKLWTKIFSNFQFKRINFQFKIVFIQFNIFSDLGFNSRLLMIF